MKAKSVSSDSDDDDDEFFDCDTKEEKGGVEEEEEEEVSLAGSKKSDLPIWSQKPEGRAKKLGKTRLLEHDDFLYIPTCQDPAPMTEDQLAEQAEVMIGLGADAEGSELRARMQSASLLSDMESFKAANPGAVLGDFVRWYSPRDWIDENEIAENKKNQKKKKEKEEKEAAKKSKVCKDMLFSDIYYS